VYEQNEKIRVEAQKIRGELKNHKASISEYMNYVILCKTLKNALLGNTIQELKDKAKVLGCTEDELKKLKTKKECLEAVLELL
jgi:hypothetical protein